jgi:two-component system, NarL family, sensor kinase
MPPKPARILLVEDNPGDARLVREMLAEAKGESFAIDWVSSLAEALERLAQGGIDLVLLDLGLPDSQGLDTFLRSYEHGSHLPFLVLTGNADEILGSTAVRHGAQDYLPKGEVTVSMLCRAIRYAIERKRTEAALEAERQKLFALLNNLPGVVHLKDANFKILFANRLFREVFGDPGDRPCYAFLHGRNEPCESCPVPEVLKTRVPNKFESSEPNSGRIFEYYNYPFCASNGSQLVLTLGIDITERLKAEGALRESEERFRAIFEQAAVGVAQIETGTGRFVKVNQKYCDIVGLKPKEMIATTSLAITHPDDLQGDLDNMQRLREGLIRKFSREKRYVRRDGSLVWVNLTVSPMWDIGQPPNYHIAVVEDITERKRTEEQLSKKTHDLGERVKELDCLYNIARLMGIPTISLDEIIQRVLELIPSAWQYPDITCARITLKGCTFKPINFRETQWGQASDILLHGDCLGRVEVYYLREKPTLDEGPFLKEERYLLETIAKALSVIIEHKQAEKKLRESEQTLRHLAYQLLMAQEQEKQKISLELHDTVAQELATLKIDLENLQRDLPEQAVEEFSSRISQLLQKLQRTLASIRTLSYDLRPPELKHFGLVQAIKLHCEEFTARTDIKVDFMAAGIEAGHLDDDAAINLYRIIQEGLTNVGRHTQAMNVIIRLVASFPKIILRLEDDGRGFDVMEQQASRQGDKHLGLLGMRERVALLGGVMKIESQLNKGTKISIEIPWKGEDLDTKEEAPHR